MSREIYRRRSIGYFLLILLLGALSTTASAAPRLLSISPAAGEVVDARSITLEGVAEGAARLVVDGRDVVLAADGSFAAGPFELEEGERRFLIVLEDAEGREEATVHAVVADRLPPAIALERTPRLTNSPTLRVAGTAVDPHLESVTVSGRSASGDASIGAGRFEVTVPLQRGVQRLEIVARDRLGHESRAEIEVELDDEPPSLELVADGRPLDGALFRRGAAPQAVASGAERVELELDGRPWPAGKLLAEEGRHRLDAVATDAAGNVSRASAAFTIDRTPPRLGRVEAAGKTLRERSFTLEGRVEGAVSVTVDGRPATLDGELYRAGPFDLDAGERVFRVLARDAAGNEKSLDVPVKSDPDAPVLSISAPAEGAVLASSPITLTGTAVDVDLASVTASVNGGAAVPATLDGDDFSLQLALVEGANTITVTATDAVANVATADRTLTLDTTPPALQLTAAGAPLQDGDVFAGLVTPELAVTDATETTTEAILDGLPWTPGTSITDLGSHELQVTVTDAAGQSSSLLRTFTVEGAAPVFSDLSPAPGTVLSAADIRLAGRAEGAVSLTVDGQAVALVAGGFTTAPISLVEGPRTFTLVATSAGGQTTTLDLTLVRDATAPSVNIGSPADGELGTEATITVSGSVSDAHFDSITVNGSPATVTGDTATGATFDADVTLIEGMNRLRARATDQAGNVSSAEVTAELDSRAPELEITDPAPGTIVGAASVTVSGRVADANIDRVEIGGVTATLAAPDGWSADVPVADGTSTLTATAFDTLGHQSSDTLEIVRDDAAPLVTISSPAEGTFTQAATIDVSGTVATGATVTVNGTAATVDAGTFSITGVELSEGENRLVARAELGGEQGTHVRTVVRDTEAPTVLGVSPADGSEGLARDTSFRITFSESLAAPPAGSWRLETAGGAAIAASGAFDAGVLEGDVFTVTPQGLLPPATEIVLVATAQLEDRAGNSLTAASWSFTTLADGAPDAPLLDPVAASLCANAVTLTGTAPASARVRVLGGGASAETRAASDGAFSLEVVLEPGRLHLLEVLSVDAEDRVSASAWAEVAQDCAPPEILQAQRAGDVFTVVFDEAIDGATLQLTVSDASGALAGAFDVSGDTATWTASAALPVGVLRLEIGAELADAAGNTLGFPWVRLFGAGEATSFFSGTVLDESTGRPLAGATVTVTRSGGVPTTDPRPEMTTAADGRFLVAVSPGTHDVTVARPGYAPVFRIVTTTTGEGTEVFTPRLEPIGASGAIGAGGGVLEALDTSSRPARLDLPAGAFAADSQLALAALAEQALPALLPYGWSPRGAAWVDLGDEALLVASSLEMPVSAPAGTLLTIAALDLETLQWRALEEQAVQSTADGTRVILTLDPAQVASGVGAFAALEADTGTTAPPAPLVGEVLGSSPAPSTAEVTGAALSFDPEVVLPTQTADVSVLYTLASEQPSGLPLTLVIQEELELVDGTLRREAPYRAQLVLYRDASGTPKSHFRLRPSVLARTQPVRLGAEDVTVLRYADEGVRGNVLGPDGGWVLGDVGDRLEVPAGALSQPTPVVLERRDVADLPLAAPAGGSVEAVLEIDLAGAVLAAAGELSFVIDPPPAAGTRALLLHVAELASGPAYRAVAELEATDTGYRTLAIDAADLAWPGVREGGFYLALALDFEPAFVRGTVIGEDGLPLEGAVVSSPQVEWIQLSNADGTYVLPVPVGEVTIDLLDPATGNVSSTTVSTSAADERADADVQATPTGPRVLSTTPADGDEVPAGIQPQISFSEAIDPASVTAGIELWREGVEVPVAFDVQGALVTVLPAATLAPGAPYELRILGGFGEGLRDLQGYSLEEPVTITFTISELDLPTGFDPSKITLYAPVGGVSQIVGEPGAVPAEHLVFVENLTSYQTTESASSAQDGSFTLSIGADFADEILFHVLIEGANEYVKLLGPFMSADRKGAYIGREASSFTTVDGVTVMAEEGTFDTFTEVRVVPQALADPPAAPWPAPGVLEPVYRFDFDFGGAEAKRPLNLRVPAPAGAQPEWYLLAKAWDFFGQPMWSMKDIMVLDQGELTTERTAPAPAASSLVVEDPSLKRAGEKSSSDPRDYKVALWSAGNFSVFRSGNPLMWAVVAVDALAVTFTDAVPGMVIEATDALEYVYGLQDWAVPSLLGQDFEISARDARTGFELFREVFEPLDGELEILPPSVLEDKGRPFLTGGEPLILQMVAAAPGTRELRYGLKVDVTDNRDGDGNLLQQQTMTVTFEQDSLIIDRRPPDDVPIPLEAKLTSMADASETKIDIGIAIESGDVTLSRQVDLGDSLLLTVGAVLRLDEWIEMQWNEALDESLDGIELELLGGQDPVPVEVTAEPIGTYETIRLRPRSGWQAGESYQLRLDGSIRDVAGNQLLPADEPGCTENCDQASITIRLEVRSQRVFQGFDFAMVRDVERLGSLLFVAAGIDGLWVLDASDPENLVNYFGGENSDLHFGFPLGGQVRGVAIDPHGRVLVSGGGVSGPGQIKILDPLEFPDNPTTNGDLAEAWRGSTLVSNQLGADSQFADMPPATPSHMEILSRDRESSWILGVDDVPAGVTMTPDQVPTFDEFTVTVSGSDGVEGQPVTLRNLTRGTWERKDAGSGGSYSLSLTARHGERLQVLRNTDSLVYVKLDFKGLAAVDFNHFYGESDDADGDGVPDDPEIVQSQVLRYYTHSILENTPGDVLCDPNGLYLGDDPAFLPTDFTILGRATDGPFYLPTVERSYGLVMTIINGDNPVQVNKIANVCGVGRVPNPTPSDIGYMTGMGVAEGYRAQVIYDDDDVLPAPDDAQEIEIDGELVKVGREKRDYIFMGNTHGHVYVVDVTNKRDLRIVAKIELPEPPAGPMTFDPETERLLVSSSANGVYVVDLVGPFPLAAIDLTEETPPDINNDGDDDRVLEQVEVRDQGTGEALNVNRRVELWRDLGLAWIGGIQNLSNPGELGLGGLVYRAPRVRFLATGDDGLQEVRQLAPYGVPTAKVAGAEEDEDFEYPGLFRIEMHLPGELADAAGELRVDLVSVGPGGLEITAAGDHALIEKLPRTSFRDEEGLLLKRQSDKPWHEGYEIFLSDPILAIADLRASHWYVMTDKEKNAEDAMGEKICRRCDLQDPEQGVYPPSGVLPGQAYRELLSGHRIAVRLQDAAQTAITDLWGPLLASQAEVEIDSVAWDISPSLEQEPFAGPSYGNGEVAPGTLLHSGEFTQDIVDLELPGVGFDFVFARSYRNQTVGGGPLGPGWDFAYRMRLRPLPDKNVDFFDGRGRRVTFEWDGERLEPPAGVFMQLTRDVAGYRLKDRQGNLSQFDRWGRLISIHDAFKINDDSGTELLFEYDAASRLVKVTADGRGLDFEYNDDGLLERVSDGTGRDTLYEYDTDGRLEKVKSPQTALEKDGVETRLVTTYAYETPGTGLRRMLNRRENLTSIEDARYLKWLELTWTGGDGDMGHRLATQKWGEDTISFTFADDGSQTDVTDRRAKPHVYKHNSTGQVTSYVDPLDHETKWTYGAYGTDPEQGLVTEVEKPSGRKMVYVYDKQDEFAIGGGETPRVVPISYPDLAKVAEKPGDGEAALAGDDCEPGDISANGSGPEIAWRYEGHHGWTHRPGMTTSPAGATIVTNFVDSSPAAKEGWPSSTNRQIPSGGETQEASTAIDDRDSEGRVKKQTHTRSDGETMTTEAEFEEGSKLRVPKTMTIRSGSTPYTLAVEHDEVGRVTKITEPGGVERTWLYNAVGWLLEECTKADSKNVCTRNEYTRAGQVKQVHQPYGESDSEHVATTFTYGLLGEVEQVQSEITPGGSVITETRSYDENLNLELLNSTGRTAVTYSYDDRNMLILRSSSDSDGTYLEWFHYNDDGQLRTYTDSRNKDWRLVYDGYGRIMQTLDPKLQATHVSYDVAGKPRDHIACNADGEAVTKAETFYDGADRLVEQNQIDVEDDANKSSTLYNYDSSSNVIKVVDPVGKTVEYVYDALQRMVEMKVDGGGVYRRTWSDFDSRGRPQLETEQVPGLAGNPSSYTRTLEYDGFDRLSAMVIGGFDRFERSYDVRGNVVRETAPDGAVTSFAYDGLDRRTSVARPEGILATYQYVDSSDSTQMLFTDGLNQTTTFAFDGLARLGGVTYPDGKTESYDYDAAGNATDVTLADGTSLAQVYDELSRLVTRTVTPAVGIDGHTTENFTYDAIGRLRTADQEGVLSSFDYDGLARLIKETTAGEAVSYQVDAAGQPTSVSLPSYITVNRTFDSLGQIEQLTVGSWLQVDYGWQGPMVATKDVSVPGGSAIINGTLDRNASRYLMGQEFTGGSDENLLEEDLSRNPRGQVIGQSFRERGGFGWWRVYDDAGRLVEQRSSDIHSTGVPFDGEQMMTSVPMRSELTFDAADNLLEIAETHTCAEETRALPLDDSMRNRPASVDGVDLEFDDNGNLVRKGDLHFTYDYRSRLLKVERETSPGTFANVATYTYDALDRRITREVGNETHRTVWDGWQAVEEYVEFDGGGEVLMGRRVYGAGLDEVVGLQARTTPGGTLDTYVPIYDTLGNLVVLANTAGEAVERYDYSPYGKRFIWADSTPPEVDQVLFRDGKVVVELSEEVRPEGLESALDTDIKLRNLTKGLDIALTLERPIKTGRNARQRLVFTLEEPVAPEDREAGDILELTLTASAFVDFFDNTMSSDPFVPTFDWQPSGLQVVMDTANPRLLSACLVGGKLRLEFSEIPDETTAPDAILLDGATVGWTLLADEYTLESTATVAAGPHSLSFTSDPFDLGSFAVDASGSIAFDGADTHIWDAGLPGEIGPLAGESMARSAAGNPFGFKGMPIDYETGFYYVRHRYYDPDLGRFITPDPAGYADSGNLYQFALNDPANLSDPTGEIVWCLAAGALSVGTGAAIDAAFDDEYTLTDGAIDFALGSLTCGAGTLLKNATKAGVKGIQLSRAGIQLSARAAIAAGIGAEVGIVGAGEMTRSFIDQQELNPGRAFVSGAVSAGIGFGVPIVGSRLASRRAGRETVDALVDSSPPLTIASSRSDEVLGEGLEHLTKRQRQLLDQLSGPFTSVIVKKSGVNLADLAALARATGNEFGFMTLSGQRKVFRGTARNLGLTEDEIFEHALKGWRFSGHVHPGTTRRVLQASPGDRAVLRLFEEMGTQRKSVVLNSSGEFQPFSSSLFDDMFGF